VAERGDEDAFWVRGIDDDLRDLLGVTQTEVRPGLARIVAAISSTCVATARSETGDTAAEASRTACSTWCQSRAATEARASSSSARACFPASSGRRLITAQASIQLSW